MGTFVCSLVRVSVHIFLPSRVCMCVYVCLLRACELLLYGDDGGGVSGCAQD